MPLEDNFGADFALGAAVGNMQVMQRNRMIELQGQEALRQVQERHLAAQADQIAYTLQAAKAEKAKEDSDLQLADQIHHTLTETVDPGDKTPDEVNEMATKATDQWLLDHNPKLALKVGQARAFLAKPELAQAALQTKENVAQTRVAGQLAVADKASALKDAQAKLALAKAAAVESGASASGTPDATEKQANALARARAAVKAAYDSGDEDASKEAEQHLSDLKKAQERQHPNKQAITESQMLLGNQREAYKAWLADPTNEVLKKEYQRLTDEVKSAGVKASVSQAPEPSGGGDDLVPIISPTGKLGKIPRKNYDKALKNGYRAPQ